MNYQNADQDSAKQLTQAEAEITNGVDVMVLDPVDGTAAAAIVAKAQQAGIPVVSYDRLILDSEPDVYISFDNEKVGQLQGNSLSETLAADGNPTGPIIKINGSPTDNNATLFKKGSNEAFETAGVKILVQYDTPDWSPDKARTFMEQQITTFGKDGPTTGQDAELAAIQRIIADEQYMTRLQGDQEGGGGRGRRRHRPRQRP